MFELLLLFSFWPWLTFAGLIVIFGLSSHKNTIWLAIAGLAAYLVISLFAFDVNAISWIVDNPVTAAGRSVGYLLIGFAWSMFKWRTYLGTESMQSLFVRSQREWFEQGDTGTVEGYRDSSYFPVYAKASWNKDRIISWITLWPISFILSFIDDMLIKAFRYIFDKISGIYDDMTMRYIPKVKAPAQTAESSK
tara:strand:- start:1270 stop:1848 length:579 start_codon:yes stop_codon:yes gene_type:complete